MTVEQTPLTSFPFDPAEGKEPLQNARLRERILTIVPRALDAAILLSVSLIVVNVRFGEHIGAVHLGFGSVDYRLFAVFVSAGWFVAILASSGGSTALGFGNASVRGVVVGTVITFLATTVLALALQSEFSRTFVLVVFPLGGLLLVANRLLWEAVVRGQRRNGRLGVRAVVIGSEPNVGGLSAKLRAQSEFVEVVAASYAPDDEQVGGSRIRSGEDVARLVRSIGAQLVLVADTPADAAGFLQDVAWAIESTGAQLALAAQVGLVSSERVSVVPIAGDAFVAIEFRHLSRGRAAAKRVFDVFASAVLIALLAPVLVTVGLAVLLDSRGGAIYRQTRVGRDGQPFQILKFRTMHSDADEHLVRLQHLNEGAGPLFKMKDDPRVTRAGRILRRWSLDELPQLVNVLRGQMSLVGPRPALVTEVAAYPEHARRRLIARPGITGLWQVSGRSDLSWEDGLRMDLSYVENWSPLGDIVILLRTFGAVTGKRGAY